MRTHLLLFNELVNGRVNPTSDLPVFRVSNPIRGTVTTPSNTSPPCVTNLRDLIPSGSVEICA